MTVTYCTAQQVVDYLGWADRSGSTDPTQTEVETLINQNEDYIDKVTGHAWRSTTVSTEHYDVDLPWVDDSGIPVYLKHRDITTFVADTDLLEVWNGSSWVDWMATGSAFTEGRANDFWLDYKKGILYIRNTGAKGRRKIRVTYRYGTSTVDKGIQKLCVLLTARDLAKNEDYRTNYAEGMEEYPLNSKIPSLGAEIDKLINRYSEVRSI